MLVNTPASPWKGIARSLPSASWLLLVSLAGTALPALASTPTTTTLAVTSGGSAATTAPSGTVVTLTASVAAGGAAVTSGQINFCDASAPSCTDIHLLGSAQLTSAGSAIFKFIPGIGSHSLKAVFAGTNLAASSSSASSALAVTHTGPYASATTLLSSGGAGSYSLTATVAAAPVNAPVASTGLISFLDTSSDNRVLGTAPLVANPQPLDFTDAPLSSGYVIDPYTMLVGDFNGDGKPDFVLNTDYYDDTLTTVVELGNGDGSFTELAPLTLAVSALATGDFNDDGNLDLIESGTSGISTLLGNGDGTFHVIAGSGPLPPFGQGVAGDFNGDGILDLALLDAPDKHVLFLKGNGDGTFAAPAIAAQVQADGQMAVGDFNGDGKLDLVLTSPADNNVRVLLGQGDGTFVTAGPTAVPSLLSSVVVADFNGDGKLDAVVLGYNTTSTAATVLLGNGDGTLTLSPATVPCAALGPIVVADFNGDGKADLGIATIFHSDINTVSIFLGVGDGTFNVSATPPGDTKAILLAAADFNGDGFSDIAVGATDIGDGPGVQLAQLFPSTATVTNIVVPGAGTHQITASYPGDSIYSASVSAAAALTGTPSVPISFPLAAAHTYGDAPFTIAATSVSTGAFTYTVVSGPARISGSTVTLTGAGAVVLQASQAAAGGYAAAEQTAAVTVAPASLSIAANSFARVFGAPNPVFTGTVTGAVNGDTFSETFTTTATAASMVGTYSILPAVTGPDLANYIVSPSGGALTISQAGTATTFTLSNGNLTFTANVASLTSGMPTGTVAFYEGRSQVGSGPVSNGSASYTATAAPSADAVVSAQYGGDANFTQSASPPIVLFSVVPANTAVSVPQSGSISDTVHLAPAPGFSGAVQLSCTNLPANATCSFQPSSVTFSGSTGATSTSVTIQTGVTAQAELPFRPLGVNQALAGNLAAAFWMPGLWTAIFAGRKRKVGPRQGKLLILLLIGVAGAALSGCGGGPSSTTPSALQTPAGTYTVQVVATGAGGLSQSAAVTVTVQ